MNEKDYKIVGDFYDQVYYQKISQSDNPNRHYWSLAKKIGIKPGEKLLDIACGTGSWLKTASDFGANIHGIDISGRAIEICQKKFPNNSIKEGIAENLPFPDAYFDIVTCLGALEHFLDQPKAIREMIRVAKPNARFLILVPNAGFLTFRLGFFKGTQQQEVKETIKSLNEWQTLFNQQGLNIVSRWADFHVLSKYWIVRKPYGMLVPRLIQALLLLVWPLSWQYQVYHLCCLASPNSKEPKS
ncbi:class I SAM-dependent methyltransferase [Methylomonas sp. LL1]|uniref:class I SAM-dependent methyltransferase n=1 Tax=Methylomonas sp. LL1 TaxID=2785785 RepID=UPI0018C3A458|nr:class I SAM-dependent methyltransferase [Methylomonas sp. LL1]QPK63420.1 class I SAM-dependent methyltransferase [Methylomonas sp. LL1]